MNCIVSIKKPSNNCKPIVYEPKCANTLVGLIVMSAMNTINTANCIRKRIKKIMVV